MAGVIPSEGFNKQLVDTVRAVMRMVKNEKDSKSEDGSDPTAFQMVQLDAALAASSNITDARTSLSSAVASYIAAPAGENLVTSTREVTNQKVTVYNPSTDTSFESGDLGYVALIGGITCFIPLYSGGGGGSACCCADPLTDDLDIDDHPYIPNPFGTADTRAYSRRLITPKCGAWSNISVTYSNGDVLTWIQSADVNCDYTESDHTFRYDVPDGELTKVDSGGGSLSLGSGDSAQFIINWATDELIFNLGNVSFYWSLVGGVPSGRYSNYFIRKYDPPDTVQPNCEMCSAPVKGAVVVTGCVDAPQTPETVDLSYTLSDFTLRSTEDFQDSWTHDWIDDSDGTTTIRSGDTSGVRYGIYAPPTGIMTGSETLDYDNSGAYCKWCLASQNQVDVQFVHVQTDYSTIPSGCGWATPTDTCRRPVTSDGNDLFNIAQTSAIDFGANNIPYCAAPVSAEDNQFTTASHVVRDLYSGVCYLKWEFSIEKRYNSVLDAYVWVCRLVLKMQYQWYCLNYFEINDTNWTESGRVYYNDRRAPSGLGGTYPPGWTEQSVPGYTNSFDGSAFGFGSPPGPSFPAPWAQPYYPANATAGNSSGSNPHQSMTARGPLFYGNRDSSSGEAFPPWSSVDTGTSGHATVPLLQEMSWVTVETSAPAAGDTLTLTHGTSTRGPMLSVSRDWQQFVRAMHTNELCSDAPTSIQVSL